MPSYVPQSNNWKAPTEVRHRLQAFQQQHQAAATAAGRLWYMAAASGIQPFRYEWHLPRGSNLGNLTVPLQLSTIEMSSASNSSKLDSPTTRESGPDTGLHIIIHFQRRQDELQHATCAATWITVITAAVADSKVQHPRQGPARTHRCHRLSGSHFSLDEKEVRATERGRSFLVG
jgi:hypothetical protein